MTITVEFVVIEGEDIHSSYRHWKKTMPWFDYLDKNKTGIYYRSWHNANTYEDYLIIEFTLPPEKETFYNLKYR